MRLVIVMVCVIVGSAGSARADNKDVARDAYQEGTRQFEFGDIKAALASFKRAYLNYEDPAFLFNIAQCQRQLGDQSEALRTYTFFLAKVPNARSRPQVEKIVSELRAAIAQEKAVVTRAPMGTMRPDTPLPPPTKSAPTPAALPVAIEPTAPTPPNTIVTTASDEPVRKRPLTRQAWFWGLVAGGVVVVAGAVTLGVVLGTRSNTTTLSPLSF
jgi:hypothetical protein